MMKKTLFLSALLLSTTALAETVKTVDVIGTNRIEKETVLKFLNFDEGQNLSPADLDEATKRLFATGLFADVSVKLNNNKLSVDVAENPIVYEVYIEGNKKIDADTLKTELMLKPRSVYTQRKAELDANRLVQVYKRTGYFGASVKPSIIKKSQNRIDLIFTVDEGEKATVQNINFVGNTAFSSEDLRLQMMTKEKRWYRIFTSTDTYDPDRLNYDKELLRRFYLKKGYVDVKIVNAFAELLPDNSGFVITVQVDEGQKYHLGDIDVKVSLPDYDAKNNPDFNDLIEIKKGYHFDIAQIEKTSDNLTDYFANQGFAFVNVTPDFKKNEATKTMDITYRVQEGQKVFVNAINIYGNSRTQDKVIRREFNLKEGDAFNASKLRRSKQKVQNLDYFSTVEMQSTPVYGDVTKTNIDVNVAEKSTGSFNFGVGWSSYDGLLFEAGIIERNVLGTGNVVNLNASISQVETQYVLGLTNPYFMGMPLSAGIELFNTSTDSSDYSSYTADSYGAVTRFGWNYTDYLYQSVSYTLRHDNITDIDEGASLYIKDQEGKTLVSMISQNLIYDKRDNRMNPTMGYYLKFGADFAGIGGDTDFVRVTGTAIQYYPVAEDVVFSLRADGGQIWGWGGQTVRVNNRFFLGDYSLRGFEYGGVGARDKATDDSLGGNWYAAASAEMTFPIGLPKELGIKAKIFTDAGFIGKPDNYDKTKIDYDDTMRASVGTGIIWNSPMGTINVDFALPVMKQKYDKTQLIRLNFGKGF